jgi:hypothetical protein
VRKVTDVAVAGYPLRLRARIPRNRCINDRCDREVFAHNTSRRARPRWPTTRRSARYILRRPMIYRATVAAADAFGDYKTAAAEQLPEATAVMYPRNLTHHRLRSLLHCGNLIQRIDVL